MIKQETQILMSDEAIDLGLGHPGADLLPTDLFGQAAKARLAQHRPSLLQYGLGQGSTSFREALAHFLTDAYTQSVLPENLLVTNGASQALDLICTVLSKPGDTVFVEEPSYFLALGIFAEHGLHVVSFPVDHEGVRTNALEAALAQHSPVFFYTVPTFQNPSGATLSPSRRDHLFALSRAHDFFIVADEVYSLLGFAGSTGEVVAPLATFEEKVFSIGSFSKILAPGLRLGWVQAPDDLLDPLIHSALLTSGGGLNPFTSGLVRVILERGWQTQHLAKLREVYAERAEALVGALNDYFPEAAFNIPKGGYFVWLELEGVDTEVLLLEAERRGVSFQAGGKFSSQNALESALRLSFSYYEPERLREGVKRLRTASDTLE